MVGPFFFNNLSHMFILTLKRGHDIRNSICKICSSSFKTGKQLTNHVRKEHGLKSREYTIKHFYGGVVPMCKSCGDETRYVAFSFKKYCKACSSIASREGGKQGGKAAAWNKGKTKIEDDRIFSPAGEKNPFWGRRHTQESLEKMRTSKRISQEKYYERLDKRYDLSTVTPYQAYVSRQKQYLEFECQQCGKTSKKTLQAFERGSQCYFCYPIFSSRGEREVADFVESLGFDISRNNRSIIAPKELDIVVSDQKVAIEYEGLYWHSEIGGKSPRAHLEKTRQAAEKHFSLFRVYADHWRDKRSIVESMIKSRLGASPYKIWARKCHVAEVDSKTAKQFLTQNHLYGHSPSKKSFVLVCAEKIVSVLTLRVPRQKKYREQNVLEICRFASLLNHQIVGGFSRLLKHAKKWAEQHGYSGMISYADLDTGSGSVYQKAGFVLMGDTGPSYWYTDGHARYDRFQYRAQKGKCEREVANDAGVYRIYGAGSNRWMLKF